MGEKGIGTGKEEGESRRDRREGTRRKGGRNRRRRDGMGEKLLRSGREGGRQVTMLNTLDNLYPYLNISTQRDTPFNIS